VPIYNAPHISDPIPVLLEKGSKDNVNYFIEASYEASFVPDVDARQVELENQVLVTGCCRIPAYVEIAEGVVECSGLRNVVVSAECIQKRRFAKPTWP
jgi:hypothetical protein